MSFRVSIRLLSQRLSLLAWGMSLAIGAQGAERPQGKPIEFSTGKPSEVGTNLSNLSAPKKDALRQLEENLGGSSKPFSGSGSLDPVMAPRFIPPPRIIVPSKRDQEKAEQKRNWMFADPKDLEKLPSPEELLGVPESSRERAKDLKLTPMEQFYERLGRTPAEGSPLRTLREDEAFAEREGNAVQGSGKDAELPAALREAEQRLGRILAPERESAAADAFGFRPQNSLDSPFSTRFNEGVRKENPYITQYRELLNSGNGNPSGLSSLNSLAPEPASARIAPRSAGLDSLGQGAGSATLNSGLGLTQPTLGQINPAFHAAPQDLNTRILNEWNPLYTPPKAEAPKLSPPKPNFNAPMRKF